MKKLVFICILSVCMTGLMYSFPFANYGNIRVPDANVMPHLMARIAFNNYLYPENNQKSDDYAYNWAGAINFGLFNIGEIGFVASGDEIYYGHAKIRIVGEQLTIPDIAIGVDNLFSEVPTKGPFKEDYPDIVDAGNYRKNSIYMSISKSFLISGIPPFGDLPARITVGAGSHRFHGTVQMSEQFEGIFGALHIQPIKDLSVISEIDGHNWNTGFEYRFNNFGARLDLYRVEEWNRRDPKLGLTLSYAFDHFVRPEDKRDFLPVRTMDRELIEVREGATLDELQRIRRQRERAEQELEEIRRLLEER